MLVSVNMRLCLVVSLMVSLGLLLGLVLLVAGNNQSSAQGLDQLLPSLVSLFRKVTQGGGEARNDIYKKIAVDGEHFTFSSCTGRGSGDTWNREPGSGARVESWLGSAVTVRHPTMARSWWYDTKKGDFTKHSSQADKVIYLETSKDFYDDQFFMILGSSEEAGKPVGLALARRSNDPTDGWLYGVVDAEGQFTGDEITFLYPDLETGLQGKFKNGEIVSAKAVKVVGTRCSPSELLELQFEPTGVEGIVWEVPKKGEISNNPHVLDPFEEKSVRVTKSLTALSTEKTDGVYASRDFVAGELVSYFNGLKCMDEEIFSEDMTEDEYEDAGAFYYGLGNDAPYSWGYDVNLELDIPAKFRKISDYTTTLGHKVNHKFTMTNTFFSLAKHPIYGGIVILVAERDIKEGEELYVNYGYTNGVTFKEFKKNIKNYSAWFIQEFMKLPKTVRKTIFE